jgi:hypothetical protein
MELKAWGKGSKDGFLVVKLGGGGFFFVDFRLLYRSQQVDCSLSRSHSLTHSLSLYLNISLKKSLDPENI